VEEFLRRIGQRKLVQWALAYAAAAFAAIQILDIIAQRFAWPDAAIRIIIAALAVGFFVTLVLAWYHGERGAQRVSGTELTVLALLLAIGGAWLLRVAHMPSAARANSSELAVESAGSSPAEQSIAVLPLVNTSGDPANDYFSDGLSDELISVLANVPDLKIIGRSSSFHFKNSTEDSRTIGAKLGVARLLEGSVRKQDNRVRIAVELVDAKDARQMWSESYDRELRDIFAVQSEIASSVASKLRVKLATERAEPPTSTRNLDAHAALLRGDYHRAQFSLVDFRQAVEFYDEAIRLDPDYAVAYARLSRTWRALAAIWLTAGESTAAYAHARDAAERAVKLAPGLGEGYLALAWLQETPDLDFEKAAANARKALTLSPGDAEAKAALAYIVASQGKLHEAVTLWRESAAINPYVASNLLVGTRLFLGLGRYQEAADEALRAIALQPDVSHAHTYLAMIALLRGDDAGAKREAELEEEGFWRDFARTLAAQHGERGAADESLRRFSEQWDSSAAFQVASVYALRKEHDAMYAALERAFVVRDSGLSQLLCDPFLAQYRDEPRFQAFCAKLGVDCSPPQPSRGTATVVTLVPR
jgi:TolB-like protein